MFTFSSNYIQYFYTTIALKLHGVYYKNRNIIKHLTYMRQIDLKKQNKQKL